MILFGFRFYINKQKFVDKILGAIDYLFTGLGLALLIIVLILALPFVVLDNFLSGR